MAIQLENFGLVVTGPVRRIQDADTGKTTLTFTLDQAREAYTTLDQLLGFVDGWATEQ